MPTRPWPQRRRSVGLGPDHIVLDGDTARPSQKDTAPNFRSVLWQNDWMDQDTTSYMGIGFGPGDIVLDGDPALLTRGTAAPAYRPMTVLAKRLDGSRCHLVRR